MLKRLRLKELGKSKIKIIGVIILLLILPVIIISAYQIQDTRSRAAPPDQLELEQGVASGSVQKLSDTSASGGQFVRLASTNTAPSPTPITNPTDRGPRGEVGPRYDFYDGQPGGNFPTFPTGTNVKVVPTSILNSANVARSLSDWINAQPDGTTIVFDSSGGGNGYGNGTEYVIKEPIKYDAKNQKRSDIIFWGYNSKIKVDFIDPNKNSYSNEWLPGVWIFKWGALEDVEFRGFDIHGPNSAALAGKPLAWEMRTQGYPEHQKGLTILVAWNRVKILDNYIHELGGDAYWDFSGDGTGRYDLFSHGAYSRDMEIAYNDFGGTANQNSSYANNGDGINFHHNYIHDTAIHGASLEVHNYRASPYKFLRNVTISDNIFENWSWNLAKNAYENYKLNSSNKNFWNGIPVNINISSPDGEPLKHDEISNWSYLYNEFRGGNKGFGNPEAELEQWGEVVTGGKVWGNTYVFGLGPREWDNKPPVIKNIVIKGNVTHLPEMFQGSFVAEVNSFDGVIIEDNDFQNYPIRTLWCDNVTVRNNGDSVHEDYDYYPGDDPQPSSLKPWVP